MEEALPKLLETVLLFLPRIGASLVVVLVFWLLSVIAGNLVARMGKRTRLAGDVISLLARAGKVALIIFGIVTALGTVGINVSALVAGLGLTGFALGFKRNPSSSAMSPRQCKTATSCASAALRIASKRPWACLICVCPRCNAIN